jgi:hypothetical protein
MFLCISGVSADSSVDWCRAPMYSRSGGSLSLLRGILGCCPQLGVRQSSRLRTRCLFPFGNRMSLRVVLLGQLVLVGLRGTLDVL